MKTATAELIGVGRYSQSRNYEKEVPRNDKESHSDYEERTWRNRGHYMPDGRMFMPPMGFKLALEMAVQWSGEKIPGRGNATYTKHFTAGVLVTDPVILPVIKETVKGVELGLPEPKIIDGEWLFVPADGKKGGSKRVWKCFPYVESWTARVEYAVFDDTITEAIFEKFLPESGKYIGLGRFRPQRGGFYGRYEVASVSWS
jgi:hypothetical protein